MLFRKLTLVLKHWLTSLNTVIWKQFFSSFSTELHGTLADCQELSLPATAERPETFLNFAEI